MCAFVTFCIPDSNTRQSERALKYNAQKNGPHKEI